MADSPSHTPIVIRKPRTISQGSSSSESPSFKLKHQTSTDYSPETRAKMMREHLQRQISTQSRGRVRSISGSEWTGRVRTDSMGSIPEMTARRPSLSFSHADEIPYFIEKPTEDELDLKEGELVPWWTSKRLILSVTCFVGFFFLYSTRVNLSTAIVCMTRPHVDSSLTNNNTSFNNASSNNSFNMEHQASSNGSECPIMAGGSKIEGEFDWDKELRGLILGAFFWGYTVFQIPAGLLSDRFGPRLMISLGMFPVAILTILCPFLAKGSPYLLLIGRVLIGCASAMMYPGMQSLWSKWSPPHERSRLVGFAFGGSQLGNALTFPISGLLCAYGFGGGWPSVFYITGLLSFAWCCVYVFFARDSPAEMASISEVEKKYIQQSLGTYGQTVEEIKRKRAKATKPWLKIITSPPVWAILLANSCGNYGAYMLLTMIPTYMKEVLKFDIKSNGAYSMIPYLVFWVFIIIGGQIADVFISKKILTIEWTRKLMCAIGMVIPAIFLVLTGYMDCQHQTEAVVLLSLSMGFCGFQFSSFFINHGDIAPRFAGTIFGITNTGASIPGIIAPYIVGAITKNGTREQWLIAFYIAAAVQVAGVIIYAVLAKGEVQDWAKEEFEFTPAEELGEIKEDEELNEDEKGNANNEKKGMLDGKTSKKNENGK